MATKEYADKVGGGSPFLKENGNYKATHTINMALLNLHKPTEPYDAATKDYVDYVNSILNKSLIRLTQLYITISKTQEENKEKINKTQEEINKTQEEINKTQKEINERIDKALEQIKENFHKHKRLKKKINTKTKSYCGKCKLSRTFKFW